MCDPTPLLSRVFTAPIAALTGGIARPTTTLVRVTEIQIPANLLPADGRFGSGPSKVRAAQLDALAASGSHYMGPPTGRSRSSPSWAGSAPV